MMDRQVPWSKFKGTNAWVDIENRVDGDFPAVSRHMAQQGIKVLGWDDWAQADVFVFPILRNDQLRDRIRWRTALAMCWLLSITAAMGEQGIFVKYKPALHNVAKHMSRNFQILAMLRLRSAGRPMT